MKYLFEIIYWFFIFLCPVFLIVLTIGVLSSIYGYHKWYLSLFIPASICGVILAEWARRKHGTTNYFAKPMNTPDLQETWEKDREKSISIRNNDH